MKRPEPRAAYSIGSMCAAYSADDIDAYIAHLEQRAEAAEASAKEWRDKAMTQCARCEVVESKLADIEKQQREPVAVVDIQSGRSDGKKFALVYTRAGHALADDVYNLYIAQPKPATELGWISCSDKTPESAPDQWSTAVAAVSELGDVFRLSCIDGHWQRTKAFVESGAREIVKWLPLDAPAADLAEVMQSKSRLPDENRVVVLEHKLENAERERDDAYQKLKKLENRKPDIMVSSEGAEAIRTILNKEMSMAGRFVSFKRPSGIGEEGMMGLFIRP